MGHTKKYLIKKAGMAFKGQLEQIFGFERGWCWSCGDKLSQSQNEQE